VLGGLRQQEAEIARVDAISITHRHSTISD